MAYVVVSPAARSHRLATSDLVIAHKVSQSLRELTAVRDLSKPLFRIKPQLPLGTVIAESGISELLGERKLANKKGKSNGEFNFKRKEFRS